MKFCKSKSAEKIESHSKQNREGENFRFKTLVYLCLREKNSLAICIAKKVTKLSSPKKARISITDSFNFIYWFHIKIRDTLSFSKRKTILTFSKIEISRYQA